jgi:dTDP-4-amino-4,6-dideoxygalactose transaminase
MSTQYLHEVVGYNFRMTDPSAAIGLVQLRRLPGWQAKRNANAAFYDGALKSVRIPTVPVGREHVYHQYTVRVREGVDRDAALKRLNERGVGARVYYPLPIHRQPVFAKRAEYRGLSLPETERATREVLSLPVHPLLTEEERAFVAAEVNASC